MSHHNIEDFKPLSVSPNFGVFDRPTTSPPGSGLLAPLARVGLRCSAAGQERWWEAEDAQRLREEEAMMRAEAEAVADAKRRAADELAERARAA